MASGVGALRWSVRVDLFSPDESLADMWMELPDRVQHEQLEDVVNWGCRDERDGLYADAVLAICAANARDAEQLARHLVDDALARASYPLAGLTVEVEATPAQEDVEGDLLPRGPADFESSLQPAPWHRSEPSADDQQLRIVWTSGLNPLERVDVDEAEDRVTITLLERVPPAFDEDGTPTATAAMAMTRCVEVDLSQPLAGRPIFDGATGEQPADIEPGDYLERGHRSHALGIDLDKFPCLPRPSGEPVPWDREFF